MNKQASGQSKLLMAITALLGWVGLVNQLYYTIKSGEDNGKTVPLLLGNYFSYFTILTNLLVAVSLTTILLRPASSLGKFFSRTTVQTALACYIVIVGVVYNIVLRPIYTFYGWQSVGNELVHLIVPVLYFIYWLMYVSKGTLNWKDAFPWLIYPFIYIIYTLIRGPFADFYPYPFVDVNKIGYSKTFTNSIFLFVAFLGMSVLFIWIDKSMGKKTSGS